MSKIDLNELPQHVAIIPDGNRRWAKKRGLAPWRGHLAGAKTTKKLIRTAFDLKIQCLSFWVGSYDNLTKRSKKEIGYLFKVYDLYFRELARNKDIYKQEVKVNFFGRFKEILPKKTIRVTDNLVKKTKNHAKYLLNFFLAYNGTDEMLQAIGDIVEEAGVDKSLRVTEKLLKKHLWSGHLPPVDFIIRTGSCNEPHNSAGFMMWQTAYSQLYFAKELYPDFGKKEFLKALKEYQRRERRMGK